MGSVKSQRRLVFLIVAVALCASVGALAGSPRGAALYTGRTSQSEFIPRPEGSAFDSFQKPDVKFRVSVDRRYVIRFRVHVGLACGVGVPDEDYVVKRVARIRIDRNGRFFARRDARPFGRGSTRGDDNVKRGKIVIRGRFGRLGRRATGALWMRYVRDEPNPSRITGDPPISDETVCESGRVTFRARVRRD